MSAIRIHALRLRGTARNYDVAFDHGEPFQDLSLVAGASRTGKTSVLEFIDYCFGDSTHPTQTEFQQHVVAAMLEVSLGGRRHVIVRRLFEETSSVQVHATSLADFARPHAVERRSINPPGDSDSLSSLLLEQVGLAGISVKEAPTNPASARKALSFRNLNWLAYLPSKRLDSHTLLREHRPSGDMQTMRQLLEIVFETADERIQIAEDQIKTISDRVAQLRAEVRAIEAFLDEPLPLTEQLDDQLSAIAAQRDDAVAALQEVDRQMRASADYPVAVREELSDAGREASRLEAELRDMTTLRDRLGPLRAQYGEDLKKLNFLQESGRLLNPLPVLLCPVCLNDLDDPGIAIGACELCGQAVETEDPADRLDVAREIRATSRNLNELTRYFNEVDDRAAQLEPQVLKAQHRERELQSQLDQQAESAVAPFLAQRDNLQRSILALRTDHSELLALHRNASKLTDRQARIERLQAERTRLNGELETLQSARPDRDVVIAGLSARFRALLATFGFPELADATISNNFVPMINGRSYLQESSEGALTLISVAWQLTMFELLVESDGPHPGFLMLDSPQKNLTQRETDDTDAFSDPAIVRRMYAHIAGWLAERPGKAQVIIVDREPPTEFSEAIVAFYSRRADQPPYGLIEDAIPPQAQGL